MLRRFIAWVASFFTKPTVPAPEPPKWDPEADYKATWAKRGYRDEEEYLSYVREAYANTHDRTPLAANYAYRAEPGRGITPYARYYPGIAECGAFDEDINCLDGLVYVEEAGTWNEDNQYPGRVVAQGIAQEVGSNRPALARAILKAIQETDDVDQ